MITRLLSTLTFISIVSATASAGAVTSGELYRTAGEGYGKFEARIRFAPGDGIISSFFLWKDRSELSSVYWNELDFEKLGKNCDLQTNSIYGLPQRNNEDDGYRFQGLCDDYYTYTYEWTPDYISWSVGGVEIRRDTGADAAAYADNAPEGLQMRFNVWPGNASFGGNFSESTLPVYQYIDWAEYSAYTPGAGDEGSDFTLSWREDFDSLPAGWSTGSWQSPLGLSTHSNQNVVFVDGIAILALTADDATGYSGTPPPDNGGTEPPKSNGAAPLESAESDGCTYVEGSPSPSRGGLLALGLLVMGILLRRSSTLSRLGDE